MSFIQFKRQLLLLSSFPQAYITFMLRLAEYKNDEERATLWSFCEQNHSVFINYKEQTMSVLHTTLQELQSVDFSVNTHE